MSTKYILGNPPICCDFCGIQYQVWTVLREVNYTGDNHVEQVYRHSFNMCIDCYNKLPDEQKGE